MTLPQDFQDKLNLVFIPFERWHQMEVDSWNALAEELDEKHEDLVYYELPTLQNGGLSTRFLSMKACEPVFPTPRRANVRSHFIWIRQFSVSLKIWPMKSTFMS
jgi:hypothetical protein